MIFYFEILLAKIDFDYVVLLSGLTNFVCGVINFLII